MNKNLESQLGGVKDSFSDGGLSSRRGDEREGFFKRAGKKIVLPGVFLAILSGVLFSSYFINKDPKKEEMHRVLRERGINPSKINRATFDLGTSSAEKGKKVAYHLDYFCSSERPEDRLLKWEIYVNGLRLENCGKNYGDIPIDGRIFGINTGSLDNPFYRLDTEKDEFRKGINDVTLKLTDSEGDVKEISRKLKLY
jgi:hypothetical protein